MAAHTTTLPSTAVRSFSIPQRPLKIAIAAAITIAGGYGLLCEHGYVSSSSAVVSAYVLDVRTPIEGMVSGLPAATGVAVHRGQLLAHLDNPRVDRQQIDALQTEESSATSMVEALTAERMDLEGQKDRLMVRADEHSSAVAYRLNLQTKEGAGVLVAEELVLKQAKTELDRGRKLHDAGILASAEFERLVSVEMIAAEQVSAKKIEVERMHVEAVSAGRGLHAEPGAGTDVAYSRQRADEIAMRLADIQRLLVSARAQAAQTHLSLASQTERSELLQHTDLVAPVDGVLWNLNSLNGERASTGDSVVSLVDCRRQFLLVTVPQDRVPEIALHQRASFRLAGESIERSGMVQSVSGDAVKGGSRKFASVPLMASGEQLATVVISFDEAGSGDIGSGEAQAGDACTVGRTARVLIPTIPSSNATRLLRRYF